MITSSLQSNRMLDLQTRFLYYMLIEMNLLKVRFS